MPAETLYSFPARLESLGAMVVHLHSTVTALLEPTALLRAETALEELLTNSIVHGKGLAMPSSTIWLAARGQDDMLNLRYEDAFAPFDPMAKIDEALLRTANPMEQRPLGGLGLLMVFRMADTFRYLHEDGHNRIDLSFVGRSTGMPDAARGGSSSVDLGA
jgi:serine/threonine-protein kinase RsbW